MAEKAVFYAWPPLVGKLFRMRDWRVMAGVIIGFGILLRVILYLHNRSLWLDEALLALNILEKPFSQLLGPLDYQQMAPVGFLFIEKFLVLTFGDSEYVLRLFPLLAGILSLLIFYGVARHILTLRGLTIALGLFAVSEPLLRYSTELKQYSSDVAMALGIYWLGLRCLENESRFILSIFLFSIVGAILIWFSHPAIFSLAGAGITLTLYCLKDRKGQHFAWLVLPAVFWFGSFAVNYFFIINLDSPQNANMVKAWSGSDAFMPMSQFSVEGLMWYPMKFFAMFRNPGGLSFYGLAAFCFLVGWTSIFSEKRYAWYMLTFSFLFTILASGVHKYPFQGRLILFLVPAMFIFIGHGVDRVIAMTQFSHRIVGVSLCALLVLLPAQKALFTLLFPERLDIEEVRPVMTYLRQNKQKDDRLYLYHSSEAAFQYYAKRIGLDAEYKRGVSSKLNWDNYVKDLRDLQGKGRVWILFSHVHKTYGVDEEKFFVHILNGMGKQLESFMRTGASVYLYDL
jgi:hypothetical protein